MTRLDRLSWIKIEQVQHAVRLIFSLFEQHGSAMAVLRHFSQAGLSFPRRGLGRGGELVS